MGHVLAIGGSMNEFSANGVYGQDLYINPTSRTVIVKTAGNKKIREKRSDGSSAHENHVALFRAIAGQ